MFSLILVLGFLVSIVWCQFGGEEAKEPEVFCNESNFTVCFDNNYEWYWQGTSTDNCKAVPNPNLEGVCLSSEFEECGTESRVTSDETFYVYNNTAVTPSSQLVVGSIANYNVVCMYNRDYDVSLTISRNDRKTIDITGYGQFEVSFFVCADHNCSTKLEHPMELPPNPKNFYVELAAPKSGLYLDFVSCRAGPDQTQTFTVDLLKDGCPVNESRFKKVLHNSEITRAEMRSFSFGGRQFVYLWQHLL
eukprot:Platyproteum_vivax@DN5719_c0_g1_i3.p1